MVPYSFDVIGYTLIYFESSVTSRLQVRSNRMRTAMQRNAREKRPFLTHNAAFSKVHVIKLRRRRRREIASAGLCLYARIIYCKLYLGLLYCNITLISLGVFEIATVKGKGPVFFRAIHGPLSVGSQAYFCPLFLLTIKCTHKKHCNGYYDACS